MRSNNFPVTALIPTLHNEAGLEKILGQLQQAQLPTVVVDNQPTASKRRLTAQLSQHFPIRYLPQAQNLGFAEAVNQATTQAKTEWLLILNDDISFPESAEVSLKKLLTFAQKEHLAMVSPVLKSPQGTIENVGYRLMPQGRVELLSKIDPQAQFSDQPQGPQGLTAACLLIQTSTFQQLGGFDKRFFAYLEDVDLSLRLLDSGERFAIDFSTTVIHQHLTTGKTLGWKKQWLDLRNWMRLIAKHPGFFSLKRNGVTIIIERLRNLSGLLKAISNLS